MEYIREWKWCASVDFYWVLLKEKKVCVCVRALAACLGISSLHHFWMECELITSVTAWTKFKSSKTRLIRKVDMLSFPLHVPFKVGAVFTVDLFNYI